MGLRFDLNVANFLAHILDEKSHLAIASEIPKTLGDSANPSGSSSQPFETNCSPIANANSVSRDC